MLKHAAAFHVKELKMHMRFNHIINLSKITYRWTPAPNGLNKRIN